MECGSGGDPLLVHLVRILYSFTPGRSVVYSNWNTYMLRGTARALRTASRISQLNQVPSESSTSHRPWVGCSHWTTPFRPLKAFSTSTQCRRDTVLDSNLDLSSSLREAPESNVDREDVWDNGNAEDVGIETSLEGIIVDQVDPSDSCHTQTQGDENNTSKDKVCILSSFHAS